MDGANLQLLLPAPQKESRAHNTIDAIITGHYQLQQNGSLQMKSCRRVYPQLKEADWDLQNVVSVNSDNKGVLLVTLVEWWCEGCDF